MTGLAPTWHHIYYYSGIVVTWFVIDRMIMSKYLKIQTLIALWKYLKNQFIHFSY